MANYTSQLTPGLWRHLDSEKLGYTQIIRTFAELILLYAFLRVVYLLYFHPLAGFPGPKLAAISHLYRGYLVWTGYFYVHSERLHKKYGPVIRLAPDELSFNTPTAYKTIYDSKPRFLKNHIYRASILMKKLPLSVAAETDPAEHARKKKLLQNAFSPKALREQEPMVTHWVDLLVKRLHEHGQKGNRALNVVRWYNMTTFDVIGDLAFGESFGSLDNSKQHFWIETILNLNKSTTAIQISSDHPWFNYALKCFLHPFLYLGGIVPKRMGGATLRHLEYTMDKITRRVNSKTTRKDFMSHVLKHKDDPTIHDMTSMATEAALLVLAGSETTATLLSGATWFLCKNPKAYQKLVTEIRNTFTSYDQINNDSTMHLAYLDAVIDESLRLLSPAAMIQYRVSPGVMVDGFYVPAGQTVYCYDHTLSHSDKLWARSREFLPERWLPRDHPDYSHEFDNDNRDGSNPWGIGPRACLGRSLAYMEARLILSKVLWTYDLKLGDLEEDQKWMEYGRMKAYVLWEKTAFHVKFIPVR